MVPTRAATMVKLVPLAQSQAYSSVPLWSETLNTLEDIEYMAFPRLLGIAEIGWTPQALRDWNEDRQRLAAQGTRLEVLGVNFYASPEVEWP